MLSAHFNHQTNFRHKFYLSSLCDLAVALRHGWYLFFHQYYIDKFPSLTLSLSLSTHQTRTLALFWHVLVFYLLSIFIFLKFPRFMSVRIANFISTRRASEVRLHFTHVQLLKSSFITWGAFLMKTIVSFNWVEFGARWKVKQPILLKKINLKRSGKWNSKFEIIRLIWNNMGNETVKFEMKILIWNNEENETLNFTFIFFPANCFSTFQNIFYGKINKNIPINYLVKWFQFVSSEVAKQSQTKYIQILINTKVPRHNFQIFLH